MVITILGFGQIWTTRVNSHSHRAAHFNTTGILASGKLRHRSCIYGYVRVDECAGFHPESAHRSLDRVYDCEPLSVWQGKRKLFLRKLLPKGTSPERYLVRISSIDIGWIDWHNVWLCEAAEVVSFSEGNGQQEALVLLPAFGWLCGAKEIFYLDPDGRHPGIAGLRRLE
jgi:hypothetical protein